MNKRLFLVTLSFYSLIAQEPTPKEELARIGILKFNDVKMSTELGYMPISLQEAIDNSLQKRFLYIRQDPKILNETLEKKAQNKPILSHEELKTISSETQSDVLVYGHFIQDAKKNEVTIFPHIYVASKNRIIPIDPVKNPIDDSLFQAVDNVAQKIVLAMAQLAQEREKEIEKATKKEQKEQVEEEKAKITNQSITQEKTPTEEKTGSWFIQIHVPLLPFLETNKYQNYYGGLKLGFQKLFQKDWLISMRLEGYGFRHTMTFEDDVIEEVALRFLGFGAGYLYPLPRKLALTANLWAGYHSYTFYGTRKSYDSPHFLYSGLSISGRYREKSWLLFEVELEALGVLSRSPSTGVGLSFGVLFNF